MLGVGSSSYFAAYRGSPLCVRNNNHFTALLGIELQRKMDEKFALKAYPNYNPLKGHISSHQREIPIPGRTKPGVDWGGGLSFGF
ncbi:hypothetical protein GCM10027516_11270 [Niabella aquatica]